MPSRFLGGSDYRTHRRADGNDSGGQQDDDEDDDEHDHHDDDDQLDILPPVGPGHFVRSLLEVLSLGLEEHEKDHAGSIRLQATILRHQLDVQITQKVSYKCHWIRTHWQEKL